ncbi:hypothetical protein KY325_03145, partial [Candidatus Woesearchaeota archaeon]|nr:hypothetical protein [Candidatus Woesearchaeota archaeon]
MTDDLDLGQGTVIEKKKLSRNAKFKIFSISALLIMVLLVLFWPAGMTDITGMPVLEIGTEMVPSVSAAVQEFALNDLVASNDINAEREAIKIIELNDFNKDLEIKQTNLYEVEIFPENNPIKKIVVNNAEVNSREKKNVLSIAEVRDESKWVQLYSIDPTEVDFETAEITVVAKGSELYKCKDWNFTTQTCYGEWALFKTGLVPGEEYTFILTPEDPGFGEIIEITKAMHLDANRTIISNIYDDVKELDDVWSETINENEYVRVTFEKELTSANDITVYPRTIYGTPRIEIYERNENEIVAEFTSLNDNVYNKVYLTGLKGSQDTFDLKILEGSLKFDHIIDPTERLWSISNSVTGGMTLTNSANANGPTTENYANVNDPASKWTLNNKEWDFVMNDSATGTGTITSVTLYLKHYVQTYADDTFTIDVYDGTTWTTVQTYTSATPPPTTNTTQNWNVTTILNTWTKINNTQVRIYGAVKSGGGDAVTWYVDTVELRVNYTVPDLTPPAIALNFPPDEYNTTSTSINFNWTATDNYDTSLSCNLTINSVVNASNIASLNNTPTNYTVSGFDDGRYNWSIACIDDANNYNTSETRDYTIDTTPPIVTISNPKSKTYNVYNLDLIADIADTTTIVDSCWYSLNQGANTTFTCGTTVGITGVDGTNNLTVYANDTLANIGNSSVQFIVNTSQALAISITYPANNTYTGDPSPSITLLATDRLYTTIYYTIYIYNASTGNLFAVANSGTLNNNTPTTVTLNPHLNLTGSGTTYWIVAAANDSVYFANSSNVYITLVPPVIYLMSPVYGYTDNDGDINFTFRYEGDVFPNASCSLYINDVFNQTNATTFENTPTTFIVTNLAEGANQNWTVYCAMDDINRSEFSIFHVDKTKPNIALNYPADDFKTNISTINFNWTAVDNIDTSLLCDLSIDNVVVANDITSLNGTAINYSVSSIADGIHFWNVTCKDNGLNANTSKTRNFTIDTTDPAIILNYPPDDLGTSLTSIDFNWTAIDNVDINLSCNLTINGIVNASNIASLNNTPTNYTVSGFDDGTYYWNVTCIDELNYTNTSETRNFTIQKNSSSCSLAFEPESPQIYGVAVNASCSCTNPEDSATLWRNGVNVTAAENNIYTVIPGANHSYVCNVSETLNYYSSSNSSNYIIYNASSLLGVGFNVSDCTFASETYIQCALVYFNTSIPDIDLIMLASMNVRKDSGGGVNEVWARVQVDNITQTEEKIRSVSGVGDEGATGIKPTLFNLSQVGEHNLSIAFRRTGSGSISVNDIDMNLGKFKTVHDNLIRGQSIESSYTHSVTSFISPFNWSINKTVTARTFMLAKQTLIATSAVTLDYRFKNLNSNETSPLWKRFISNSQDVGSATGIYIEENETSTHNETIESKIDAGTITVTVNSTILDFDLKDNESNAVDGFHATNPATNSSLFNDYNAGIHDIVNKTVTIRNGTGYFIAMTTTFTTLTQAQTPTYFINATGIPESNCYSKKERYLSSNSDIGNVYIYTICDGLTIGGNYTFHLWLNVSTGETVRQLDESLNGFEVTAFDISTANLPPLANDITNPLDGQNRSGMINITWNAFTDPNQDSVTYNVSLYNPDNTLNQTINGSTNLTHQLFNTTIVNDGYWLIYVIGCDPSGECSNSSVNFTIDNTPSAINLLYPADNLFSQQGTFNFSWTAIDNLDPDLICNLTINNVVNASNITSLNNTPTNYTISGFEDGVYHWNVTCIDDANNTNTSDTRTFTIDTTKPTVTLNFPPNNYNTAIRSINFNWTATNGADTNLTCNLTIDGVVNASNIASLNNTPTNYSVSDFSDGTRYWNVTCIDDANNYNTSETWNFTVDATEPTVIAVSPDNKSVDGDGVVYFNCSAADSGGLYNISLYINSILNQSISVNGTVQNTSFTITNITDGNYSWYCEAYDIYGNNNISETRTVEVNRPALPNSTNYAGNTTIWENLPDLSNVCNGTAIIDDPPEGRIRWYNCVDARSQDFNTHTNISYNVIEVIFGLNPTFNTTAELTFRNLTWDAPPLILKDGILCNETYCSNASYNISTGIAVFNVTGFTNYTTVGNSQLEIWDETDPDKNNLTRYPTEQVDFFAN